MWLQLGSSLDQIGRMALLRDQQRKEEERQAGQDRLAAEDRTLRLAQQGIQFFPTGQPVPGLGGKTPPTGTSALPMAIPTGPAPGPLSAPAQDLQAERMGLFPASSTATAMPIKASLSALGKAIQPRDASSEVGAVLRATPEGQYVRTGMSPAQEEEAAARSAAKVTRAGRESVAAAAAAAEAREAESHLNAPYWGARPRNLGVEATNHIGRQLAGQQGAGGAGGGGGTSSRVLPAIETQIRNQEQALARAEKAVADHTTRPATIPRPEAATVILGRPGQPGTGTARTAADTAQAMSLIAENRRRVNEGWTADSATAAQQKREAEATLDTLNSAYRQAAGAIPGMPAALRTGPNAARPAGTPVTTKTPEDWMREVAADARFRRGANETIEQHRTRVRAEAQRRARGGR